VGWGVLIGELMCAGEEGEINKAWAGELYKSSALHVLVGDGGGIKSWKGGGQRSMDKRGG